MNTTIEEGSGNSATVMEPDKTTSEPERLSVGETESGSAPEGELEVRGEPDAGEGGCEGVGASVTNGGSEANGASSAAREPQAAEQPVNGEDMDIIRKLLADAPIHSPRVVRSIWAWTVLDIEKDRNDYPYAFKVQCGPHQAIVPANQLHQDRLSVTVGQELFLFTVANDFDPHNIIFKLSEKQAILACLKGHVLPGRIREVQPYGVVVKIDSLPWFNALVPTADLCWRSKDERRTPGDPISFVITTFGRHPDENHADKKKRRAGVWKVTASEIEAARVELHEHLENKRSLALAGTAIDLSGDERHYVMAVCLESGRRVLGLLSRQERKLSKGQTESVFILRMEDNARPGEPALHLTLRKPSPTGTAAVEANRKHNREARHGRQPGNGGGNNNQNRRHDQGKGNR